MINGLKRPFFSVVTGIFLSLLLASNLLAQIQGAGNSDINSVLDDPLLVEEGTAGLDALYDMRYEEADSIFSLIELRYDSHPVGPFLKALVVWWQILPRLEMGPTMNDYAFYDAMEQVIERSDEMLDANPEDFDAMFFKGAALGFRGRLRSNRKEWLAAATDGKETLDLIFKIAESDTSNADYQFGKGVYDYFASVIPERYPIVRPMMFFFPDADRERGLRNLRFTAQDGHFIRTEAAYFLLQIHLFYDPNFEAARTYSQWLRDSYPQNAYFHVLEGRVFARWSQWVQAEVIFRDVVDRHDQGRIGYNPLIASQALYYLGFYDMLRGHLDDAFVTLDRVAELGEPIPTDTYFKVNAALRRGMIHDLLDRRSEAIQEYENVLQMEDKGNAHEKAKQYRRNPYSVQ